MLERVVQGGVAREERESVGLEPRVAGRVVVGDPGRLCCEPLGRCAPCGGPGLGVEPLERLDRLPGDLRVDLVDRVDAALESFEQPRLAVFERPGLGHASTPLSSPPRAATARLRAVA